MNALDLIMLGRQLTKIGEDVLRGSGGRGSGGRGSGGQGTGGADAGGRGAGTAGAGTAGAGGEGAGGAGAGGEGAGGAGARGAAVMAAGPSLVLRDVFAHPGSSISDITGRTGLPQSYVSESVARLRGQGILETSADPADGRRTLVRVSAEHPRTVALKGSASVDGALAAALGETDGGPGVTEIIGMLAALAERLRPESPGPIRRQLEQARTEL
jgi:Winged helix DNA-binding domain